MIFKIMQLLTQGIKYPGTTDHDWWGIVLSCAGLCQIAFFCQILQGKTMTNFVICGVTAISCAE
jgi:hypothetical protein